ncbi:MAG: PQQ-binding-like beta-propeller repeat protein [Candidatus Odinarchaeota archaeon]
MKRRFKIVISILIVAIYIASFFIILNILNQNPSESWYFESSAEESFGYIAISANGNYCVAGSNKGIYYFNNSSHEPLWFYSLDYELASLAFSSNGEYIVAGTRDKKLYFFHNSSSTPLWSFTTSYSILSLDISSNGSYFAAGCSNGETYLFNKSSSTPLWTNLVPSSTGVGDLAISSNGNYIITGCGGDGIYWYERTNSTPISHTEQGGDWVAISSDGNYTVSARGGVIYLYNNSRSSPVWLYDLYGGGKWLDMSSDGKYIVTTSMDGYIYLFDRSSSIPLWQYKINVPLSVSISSNGEYIAAADLDNTYFFNRSSNNPLWSRQYGGEEVAISSDGGFLAMISGSKVLIFNTVEPPTTILGFSSTYLYILIGGIVGVIIIVILIVFIIRGKKLWVKGLRVFISHAFDDFNKYRIAEVAKYLKSHPEISHVYYCEEDLTGNIDDWMLKTVPRCQILIFFSSERSLNSQDCINELKLARKFNIEVIPVLGVNLKWEDLEKVNINRELGQEFDPMEFEKFKENIYKYLVKFASDLKKEISEKKSKKTVKR